MCDGATRMTANYCKPNCQCGRHYRDQCQPGCTCGLHCRGPECKCHRHRSRRGQSGKKCMPDCSCGRHGCEPGCSCGKHNNPLVGRRKKEDNLHIVTQHDHVRAERGHPNEYSCEFCSGRARDWANIHDTDRLNTENYRPLCRRCHIIYDRTDWMSEETLRIRILDSTWRSKAISFIMERMRDGSR